MNNHIQISHLYYLGVYQDEYENWALYQKIKIISGWNGKKTAELAVHVTHAIIIKSKTAYCIIERGMGKAGS